MAESPYNPLDRVELGKSVERALLARSLEPLPPQVRFTGAGLYALYYVGDFPAYRLIAPPARSVGEMPIYVGRAVPKGARAGLEGLASTAPEPVLFSRLREHASNIRLVERRAEESGHVGIRLADFKCRYLVVDDIWVPLAEALMIGHYRPVWNGVVQGFGIHDPGSGRGQQARSDWDTLHPGRLFADRRPPASRTDRLIAATARRHLELVDDPDIDIAPPVDLAELEELASDDLISDDDTPD